MPHVKSNRKKSCSSRKNLTQNRSPKEGHNGVRHENEKELLNSKSQADFKSDFLKEKHCLKKLEEKKFDIKKFWSRSPDEASVFRKYENNVEEIKC